MRPLDEFLADVAQSQFGWAESLRWTYDKTRRLRERGVLGSLVECGVGAGCHPAVMARACIDADEVRPIRLFDSFKGVPHGGPHDTEWNDHHGDGSGDLESSGVAACSLADVTANLERWLDVDLLTTEPAHQLPGVFTRHVWPFFSLHEGWFQQTVPPVAAALADDGERIAFLRLDGDLYESTRVCLEHLYPLVSSGGCVVVDDWNLDGCRKAVCDYLASTNQLPRTWFSHYFPQAELGAEACEYEFWPVTVEPVPITESGDVWWQKP
ncbi:MAG: hypothetical protein KGI71_04435 [Patescibacteria group bacterium]|nr:hypothetical protein [Patescibacteria group bacterium]